MRLWWKLAGCGICLAMFWSMITGLLTLTLIVQYIAFEAWNDGISMPQAIKDAIYMLSEVPGSPFQPLNGKLSSEQMPVVASDDHITAVCKTSLYLKTTEVPVTWPVLDTADPVPTKERLEAYVQACREVYQALEQGSEHRAVLDAFHPRMGVSVDWPNVTSPIFHGPLDEEAYIKFRQMRDQVAAERPSLEARRKPAVELEPEYARERIAFNSVQPVVEEVVPPTEVAKAIYEGRVVRFDARPLLPKEIFNRTLADFADMHGDEAGKIPVYLQRGASTAFGARTLKDLGERVRAMLKADKAYHVDQVPFPRRPEHKIPPPKEPWLLFLRQLMIWSGYKGGETPESDLHFLRRVLLQPTINVRRLRKLNVELEKTLGSPEWLERSWSMLWAGAVGSWIHNDEPDNLLIAVNGNMTVIVFDQKDTDIISGARGPVHAFSKAFDLQAFHADRTDPAWLAQNPWIHKFPYIRVHLQPGMGVTVPSRAYHSIWMEDSERLLLNAFLVPRYKSLEKAPNAKHSFFGPGSQPKDYMALLHLKMSSLFRLWDTKRLGGFFEVQKLEIF